MLRSILRLLMVMSIGLYLNADSPRAQAQGRIVAWGSDYAGMVSNAPIDNDIVAVSASSFFSLALRSNGSLISWGDDYQNALSDMPTDSNFVAVSAGHEHSVALHLDGSLVSWGGRDDFGQVSDTPTSKNFVAISAGGGHSVALRSDGSLIAWGFDWDNEVFAGRRVADLTKIVSSSPGN